MVELLAYYKSGGTASQNEKVAYHRWLSELNALCWKYLGVGHDDLPDIVAYRSLFNEGLLPEEVLACYGEEDSFTYEALLAAGFDCTNYI